MSGVLHVLPLLDLVEHDASSDQPDCVCGPQTRPVKDDGGAVSWLIVHHALDGREQKETSR